MTLTDEELDEVQNLLYTQNYAINHRYGSPEYEASMKRSNLRLLEIATNGAYPVKPDYTTPKEAPSPPASGIDPVAVVFPVKWKFPAGGTLPAVISRFTPEQFRAYVQWVRKNEKYSWTPSGITMHHTAVPNPSYDKWRDGWTEQLLVNARSGYIKDRGFKACPHIFTDQNGIWVVNPLSLRGTHATSYNSTRYGIEMLLNGDDKAQVESAVGRANLRMGQIATAILMKDAGISTGKLNFHRHDPETSKTCPGKFVDFSEFEAAVIAIHNTL